MYKCKICGEELSDIVSSLRRHLRRKHKLKKHVYAEQYEPEWLENGKAQVQDHSMRNEGTKREREHKERLESGVELLECKVCGKRLEFLGKHLSASHGMTGKEYLELYPGSELATSRIKELRSEVAQTNKEQFREMVKEKWKDPEFVEMIKDVVSENTSERNREMWKNPEYRAKQRDRISKMSIKLQREGVIRYKGKRISVELEGKTYNFKSTWELGFALYLMNNNIDFEYETMVVRYERDGMLKRYLPDFIVGKTIYEVKGWEKDKEKTRLTFDKLRELGYEPILVNKDFVMENGIKPFIEEARKIYKEHSC